MSTVAGPPRLSRFGWNFAGAKSPAAKREDPAVPAVLIATADPALRGRWKEGLQGDYPLRDVSDRNGLERTNAALVPDVLLLDLDLLAVAGAPDLSGHRHHRQVFRPGVAACAVLGRVRLRAALRRVRDAGGHLGDAVVDRRGRRGVLPE